MNSRDLTRTFREAQEDPTGEPHTPQPELLTGSLCRQLPDLLNQAWHD